MNGGVSFDTIINSQQYTIIRSHVRPSSSALFQPDVFLNVYSSFISLKNHVGQKFSTILEIAFQVHQHDVYLSTTSSIIPFLIQAESFECPSLNKTTARRQFQVSIWDKILKFYKGGETRAGGEKFPKVYNWGDW